MVVKLLLIFSFLSGYAWTERVLYTNYTLYKINPENEAHLQFLKNLHEANDGLNFWKAPSRVNEYVSVVSPPERREDFEKSLVKRSIRSEVMLENIQDAFDAQVYSRRKRSTNELLWTSYQTRTQINEWFQHLEKTHSDMVTVIHGGISHEGLNITGVRIARGSPSRSFVLLAGEIGADWLSPVILTYIVDQLVTGEDPEAKAASEDFAFYIFPIVNPDGHDYSNNKVRLWIKNRNMMTYTSNGINLSKNWNSHWGESGGSFDRMHDNFVGLGPFSEIETRTLSRYIASIPNISGFLDFRAFGQRILIPFAHTSIPMSNYHDMIQICRRAAGALSVKYNTRYNVDMSSIVHDGSTGSVADWVKRRFYPPVVATYLTRDEGIFGYTLPPNQVKPSCEESFDALMGIIREAKNLNVFQ